MKIKKGDRVKVKEETDVYFGLTGTVLDATEDAAFVKLDLPFVHANEYTGEDIEIDHALFSVDSLELLGQTKSNKEWEDLWEPGEDDG